MKTNLLLSVPTQKCSNQNLTCFVDVESSIQLEKMFGKEGFPWYSIHIPEAALAIAEHSYIEAGVNMDYFSCMCQ